MSSLFVPIVKIEKIEKHPNADNLDRVRIKDLDINYIRELESKRLPIVAEQLLKGIT